FDKTQEYVTGSVTLNLYKGNLTVVSRKSPYSLYRHDMASFDTGSYSYNHQDAEGFINLLGLPAAVRARLTGSSYETLAKTV
ncbi:MAG TPA: argininosuccinate synthase, partial [Terriglobia bacterium]|nr:argininosuccinate synthase [Terriglobia bacterium]